MNDKKYYHVDSCVEVVFDEESGFYKLNPCSSEDTRRAYLQMKSDGIAIGENRLQLYNANNRPKQIIMMISRTNIKAESADEVYKVKKNSGGNRKKMYSPAAESGSIVDMIAAVPA